MLNNIDNSLGKSTKKLLCYEFSLLLLPKLSLSSKEFCIFLVCKKMFHRFFQKNSILTAFEDE